MKRKNILGLIIITALLSGCAHEDTKQTVPQNKHHIKNRSNLRAIRQEYTDARNGYQELMNEINNNLSPRTRGKKRSQLINDLSDLEHSIALLSTNDRDVRFYRYAVQDMQDTLNNLK